jgi:hypothetical protein
MPLGVPGILRAVRTYAGADKVPGMKAVQFTLLFIKSRATWVGVSP